MWRSVAHRDVARVNFAMNMRSDFQLNSKQVDLWLIDLNVPIEERWPLLLDAIEQKRAGQFKFVRDKNHFMVSHAILRILLSNYLLCAPDKITFEYNEHGKPFLNNPLQFNLSHSKDYAVVAITLNDPIGVDIEYQQPVDRMDAIVHRFFSAKEIQAYNALSDDQKVSGFYNAWTRKEAFVKAIGKGIFYALDHFDVTLDQPAKILSIKDQEASAWQLQAFDTAPHYAAAVAWKGGKKRLNVMTKLVIPNPAKGGTNGDGGIF